MAASVVGAIVGLFLIVLARRGKDVPMPFGPYLAAAGVVALFWGPAINRHYVALLY
jgi:leader peptidase (prepilin peptidase)/N-methyltransferase